MATIDPAWKGILEDADVALRDARRVAADRPSGTAEQAAAASMVTRLPEFIRDVRLAVRRRRSNPAAYRSVFEQLITSLRAIA